MQNAIVALVPTLNPNPPSHPIYTLSIDNKPILKLDGHPLLFENSIGIHLKNIQGIIKITQYTHLAECIHYAIPLEEKFYTINTDLRQKICHLSHILSSQKTRVFVSENTLVAITDKEVVYCALPSEGSAQQILNLDLSKKIKDNRTVTKYKGQIQYQEICIEITDSNNQIRVGNKLETLVKIPNAFFLTVMPSLTRLCMHAIQASFSTQLPSPNPPWKPSTECSQGKSYNYGKAIQRMENAASLNAHRVLFPIEGISHAIPYTDNIDGRVHMEFFGNPSDGLAHAFIDGRRVVTTKGLPLVFTRDFESEWTYYNNQCVLLTVSRNDETVNKFYINIFTVIEICYAHEDTGFLSTAKNMSFGSSYEKILTNTLQVIDETGQATFERVSKEKAHYNASIDEKRLCYPKTWNLVNFQDSIRIHITEEKGLIKIEECDFNLEEVDYVFIPEYAFYTFMYRDIEIDEFFWNPLKKLHNVPQQILNDPNTAIFLKPISDNPNQDPHIILITAAGQLYYATPSDTQTKKVNDPISQTVEHGDVTTVYTNHETITNHGSIITIEKKSSTTSCAVNSKYFFKVPNKFLTYLNIF